jgi:hypothetical protein
MIPETITVVVFYGNIWMIKLVFQQLYKSIYKNKFNFLESLFNLIGVIDSSMYIMRMMNHKCGMKILFNRYIHKEILMMHVEISLMM